MSAESENVLGSDAKIPGPETVIASIRKQVLTSNPLRRDSASLFPKARLALFALVAMVCAQLWVVQKAIWTAGDAVESPISFPSEWLPGKADYYPGDVVKFTYLRDSKADSDLLILTVDSFRNLETHEVYQGAILVRVVESNGTQELRSLRTLPEIMEPGRYILEGWVSSQTTRRSMPTRYHSLPFNVLPKDKSASSVSVSAIANNVEWIETDRESCLLLEEFFWRVR